MRTILIAAALFAAATTAAHAQPAADPLDARIEIADVDAFFRIYDAAGGRPDAAALQPYIDNGSAGVRGFIPNRIVSAANLAARIAQRPQIYSDARVCAPNLGDVRARVRSAFLALEALYSEATYPQTYILIGADNSGGTANSEALMIGLEVMCRSGSPDAAALDIRLTHIIAHEMVHSLQSGFAGETVLSQSLNEGAAEFIGEMMTGRISNGHLITWTAGREAEIEHRFVADMDSRDLSRWLYNGVGTREEPGDLGYWVGYRIVRSYYERAADKRQAIRDIIQGTDARAFLAASGWQPGAQ